MIFKQNLPDNYSVSEFYNEPQENEVVNFKSYLLKDSRTHNPHQLVVFDSLFDMIYCVNENMPVAVGGRGAWVAKNILAREVTEQEQPTARKSSLEWRYGNYINRTTAAAALLRGEALQSDVLKVSKIKGDMLVKHPELFQLERSAARMKRKRKFSDDGGELNIDRYMSGEVEVWEKMSKRPIKKSMRLCYNMAMTGEKTADAFISKIVLIACFVDILETAGITTEVWFSTASNGVSSQTNTFATYYKVKNANEKIDVSKMIIAGAAFVFRYYGFALYANTVKGNCCTGYGSSLSSVANYAIECLDFDLLLSSNNSDENIIGMFSDVLKNL